MSGSALLGSGARFQAVLAELARQWEAGQVPAAVNVAWGRKP